LAIRLLLITIGVGVEVGIGIGIDSDDVLWLVLTHGVASLPEFVSIATMRSGKALRVAFPSDKSATHRIAGHPGWRRTPTRKRVQSRSSAVDLGQWLCRCLQQCSAGSIAKHAEGGPWRCNGPLVFHRNDCPSRHTRSMYGTHPVSRIQIPSKKAVRLSPTN
jgi:hypothetical protein